MHVQDCCPVCGNTDYKMIFSVKDYTVSLSMFDVVECTQCSHRFTREIPMLDEIGTYYKSDQYISHTDSNQGLLNKVYQFVRNISLVSKRELIEQTTSQKKGELLDYGCGTGAFLNEMKYAGWHIAGIEPDAGAMDKAIQLTGGNIQSPEFLASLESERFDAITLWHVLEHVHTLHETIDQLKALLKPGGTLIIAVPNYTSYDARYYKNYWAAYDVPRHLYHFSPMSMQKFISSHGMTVVKILPMWFDSFYVSLLSEKYRKNILGPLYACLIGLASNINALFNKQQCSSQIYVIKK
jgi:2-polyprenyl-3-methyl-5-hydroxy-6-metoxy-1,4-benzoquinol methylase